MRLEVYVNFCLLKKSGIYRFYQLVNSRETAINNLEAISVRAHRTRTRPITAIQ